MIVKKENTGGFKTNFADCSQKHQSTFWYFILLSIVFE